MSPSVFKDLARVTVGKGGGRRSCRRMIISLDLELFRVRLLAEAHVDIDTWYILIARQRLRYSKYYTFEYQSYILHSNTPYYSETNAESIAVLHDTIFETKR